MSESEDAWDDITPATWGIVSLENTDYSHIFNETLSQDKTNSETNKVIELSESEIKKAQKTLPAKFKSFISDYEFEENAKNPKNPPGLLQEMRRCQSLALLVSAIKIFLISENELLQNVFRSRATDIKNVDAKSLLDWYTKNSQGALRDSNDKLPESPIAFLKIFKKQPVHPCTMILGFHALCRAFRIPSRLIAVLDSSKGPPVAFMVYATCEWCYIDPRLARQNATVSNRHVVVLSDTLESGFTRITELAQSLKADLWWNSILCKYTEILCSKIVNLFYSLKIPEPIVDKKAMPKKISEYKNHPLFVIEKHLKSSERLNPNAKIVAKIRGVAIYSRSQVSTIKTSEEWMRLDKRRVQNKQEPVGISGKKELYAIWQTETDDEENTNEIPTNQYGSVDVHKKNGVPRNCEHIAGDFAEKAADILGIQSKPAIVGFERRGKRAFPVKDGVVVLKKHQEAMEAVIEAMQKDLKDEQDAERKRKAKIKEENEEKTRKIRKHVEELFEACDTSKFKKGF